MADEDTSKKPEVDVEVGAIGVDDYGAYYADQLRLPRDGVLRVRGGGDLAIYESQRQEGQVFSTFQQRRTAVISAEYAVDAGAEDPKSQEAAEFLRDNLKELSFDRICFKMLNGVYNGYQPGECIWAARGTQIWLKDVKVRYARRFRFGRSGELRLVSKSNAQGVVMPDRKFWVFTAGAEDDDDPYGLGLGYYLYWPVFLKMGGMRHASLFVEQMARGRYGATVPQGSKDDVIKSVKNTLKILSGGGSVVVSDNVAIKLYEGARNSGGDYMAFLHYLDSLISKIVLSQTMTTDNGSSYAQASVHQGVADDVVKTDADLLCESFNQGPVRWLTEWNFPGAVPPRVWRSTSPPADTKAQVERDKVLTEIGFEPTDEYVRDTYGEGFVRKKTQQRTSSGPSAEDQAPPEEQADLAEGAEEPEDEWRVISPTVQALEDLLEECADLSEFQKRLGEVAQTDKQRQLVADLARVMFVGSIAGQVGANSDGTQAKD